MLRDLTKQAPPCLGGLLAIAGCEPEPTPDNMNNDTKSELSSHEGIRFELNLSKAINLGALELLLKSASFPGEINGHARQHEKVANA